MKRALAVAVVALVGAVGAATPASAAGSRMQLACDGIDLVVERSNGSSWWGSDGAVYTTRHLVVVSEHGTYEKHYGHVTGEVVTCAADHVVGDHASHWTVDLVRAAPPSR